MFAYFVSRGGPGGWGGGRGLKALNRVEYICGLDQQPGAFEHLTCIMQECNNVCNNDVTNIISHFFSSLDFRL